MLKIAVAKGRIAEKVIPILNTSAEFGGLIDLSSRKLIFTDEKREITYIIVKPGDLPVYVESGAADVGLVGKDVLMESECSVYEILDLKTGRCRMAVAGLPGKGAVPFGRRKIATKYPRLAGSYFKSKAEPVEIIKLEGSIELAPLVGLSDVIVDIVESGKTLEENGLVIYEEICSISTRLIANKVSYKLKNDVINRFAAVFG